MGVVLDDIRKKLLEKLGAAEQKQARMARIVTDADKEVRELVTALSGDDIASLVRKINLELYQNRELAQEIERKNNELRRELAAIQSYCKHPYEEVSSERSTELLRTCKNCGRSRLLIYSISRLHGQHGA